MQTKQGEDVTLRIIVDEQIQSIGSKRYLKVQFDELTTSRLMRFKQEEMGIFDVALLTECEQLIDVDSGMRYNVSINAEALVPLKIVQHLSEYPVLESTILSLIEDLQLKEAEEYEEGVETEEYLEAEYEEGMEEEPEYIEPDYDG